MNSHFLRLKSVLPVVEVRVNPLPFAEDNHPRFYIIRSPEVEVVIVEFLQKSGDPGVDLLLPGSKLLLRLCLLKALAHGLHEFLEVAHKSFLRKLCLGKVVTKHDINNLLCVLVLLVSVSNNHLPLNHIEEIVGGSNDSIAEELVAVDDVLIDKHMVFFFRDSENCN